MTTMPTNTKPYSVSVFPAVTTAKQSREEVMTSYNFKGDEKVIRLRFTPKQTRHYTSRDNDYRLSDIKLYRVVLPNGKEHLVASRCSPAEVKAFMEGTPVAERLGAYNARNSDNYYFLPGTQDEKGYTIRATQVVSHKRIHGETLDDYLYDDGNLKYITRGAPDRVRDHVVAQQWMRWGRAVVPTRSIIYDTKSLYYDDWVRNHTLNPHYSLPLTEFRASRYYNPYDEPEHEVPRKVRADRIALNEAICAEAMKPSRVEKMIEKYGMDWLEQS